MSSIPVSDPGQADARSATRYLLWLFKVHRYTVVTGVVWGCVWMVSMALTPYGVGQALDQIIAKDTSGVVMWSLIIVGLALITALGSIMRHRIDTFVRLGASFRTVQLVTRKVTQLGASLDKRVAAGEIVSVSTTDITSIGYALDVAARGIGAIVTIAVVVVLMLTTSIPMGLVVLIGVPLLLLAVGPLLRPLHARAEQRRDRQADLTERANDIVSGLRVLRGIGGESAFGERYRRESRQVRDAGIRVARIESALQATEILLPGILVVGVVWLGARLSIGDALTPGELVTFYGYAAFLVMPMRMVTELVDLMVSAHVAARRVVDILSLPVRDPKSDTSAIGDQSVLVDPESGLRVRPGVLTAVAVAVPEHGIALASRLGGYDGSNATVDGKRLSDLPNDVVRKHILVSDNDAQLFSGSLRDDLGAGAAPHDVDKALHDACATSIIDALPDGLDSTVAARGLSFSGGEQQRLRLARSLLADPEILILVEPSSAVDAHTESRIAGRLRQARDGRTTVVITSSPLLLDQAEEVAYLAEGKVVATDTHRELVASTSGYAATVLREEA